MMSNTWVGLFHFMIVGPLPSGGHPGHDRARSAGPVKRSRGWGRLLACSGGGAALGGERRLERGHAAPPGSEVAVGQLKLGTRVTRERRHAPFRLDVGEREDG